MGTEGGREGIKVTAGTTGTGATGICTGAANGCGGGVPPAASGLDCGARTDLVTSSNQRSASDGVRLWADMAGEAVGGATIAGVADVQSPPDVRKKKQRHKNDASRSTMPCNRA